MDLTLLWIPATLAGAAGQIARNAAQRRLTEIIGTIGATQVRFLYGFPFALIFLGLVPGPWAASPCRVRAGISRASSCSAPCRRS